MPLVDTLITLDSIASIPYVIISLLMVFRAWTLRRALVDNLYRRRALWTGIGGLGSIALAVAFITDGFAAQGIGIFANQLFAFVFADVIWGFTFLALYGWVYTNINVALNADFLHRDALAWRRGLRYGMVGSIAILYIGASSPIPIVPVSSAFNLIFTLAFLGFTVYSVLVLLIAYNRIQDKVIKGYMKWFGITLLIFVLNLVLLAANNNSLITPLLLFAYAGYRTAGSLAIKTRSIIDITALKA